MKSIKIFCDVLIYQVDLLDGPRLVIQGTTAWGIGVLEDMGREIFSGTTVFIPLDGAEETFAHLAKMSVRTFTLG